MRFSVPPTRLAMRLPHRYRMRRPADPDELRRLDATERAIANSIKVAAANGHSKIYLPLVPHGPRLVAQELIAAVNHANRSGVTRDRQWQAYVDLFDALHLSRKAFENIAALPPAYRPGDEALQRLCQDIDQLMPAVDCQLR